MPETMIDKIRRIRELDAERAELLAEVRSDPDLPALLELVELLRADESAPAPAPHPGPPAVPVVATSPPPAPQPPQPYIPAPGTQSARVIEALRSGPLSLAVLAERTDIPRESVDAVCSKLRQRGLIVCDQDGRRRLVEVAA